MNAKTIIAVLFITGVPTCLFAQKVKTVIIDGNTYAAISSEGLPRGYEPRNETTLYYSTPLYTYSATGDTAPEGTIPPNPNYSWPVYVNGSSGEVVQVKKIVRHCVGNGYGSYSFSGNSGVGIKSSYNPNTKISTLFAVAPTDIYDDGATKPGQENSPKMNWVTASGFLASANTNAINLRSSATERGCYMYQGKAGNDKKGTWRLPTQRELILMCILQQPLKNISHSETGFTDFHPERYWSASERDESSGRRDAYFVEFTHKILSSTIVVTTSLYVRCIRDITP